MIAIIVLSHAHIAEALKEGAEMIVGDQPGFHAFGLQAGESPDALRERLERALVAEAPNEVLVLTDLRSGTPFNVAVSLMEQHRFRHLSGVNLGLLLEALLSRDRLGVDDLCHTLAEVGPTTIVDVNAFLEG